jgi:hypothetical protein
MKEIKAPNTVEGIKGKKVFLAGSIEQDSASLWQDKVVEELSGFEGAILNPRRTEWDSSWKQEIENKGFRSQVDWELDALEASDIILMYFDEYTKSPITLLELGLFANSKKLIVCCGKKFWRKGNVDILCERNEIAQVNSLDELKNSS